MSRRAVWPPRIVKHATGQARVTIGGKDYYLGAHDSPEARQNYIDLISRLGGPPAQTEQMPTPPAPARTVAEGLAAWNRQERVRYRGTKEDDQFKVVIRLVLSQWSSVPLMTFGVRDLERIREAMILQGWSSRVIGRQITRVRTIWRWLERQGLAPRGSWEHLRSLGPLPPNDKRVKRLPRRQPASWPDVARLCRASSKKVRDLILLLWFTGARPGEICRITVEEIDQVGPVWWYRPGQHKNAWRGQERAIPLGPICQKILRPYIKRLRSGYLVRPPGARNPYYSPESLAQAIRRGCHRAGVKITAYQLRHAAKDRITREYGLDVARALLGQSSLETTNGYGSQVDRQLAQKAAS